MSIRWTRVMAAAGLTLSSIFAAAPARADDCPPLDLSCVAGDVVDGVESVVEDTVDTVSGTVDPVVDETKDTIGEILGGGQDEPPAGGGGGGGGAGGNPGGGGRYHGGGGGNVHDHRRGAAGPSSDAAGPLGLGSAPRPPIALGTGTAGSSDLSVVPAVRPVGERPDLPERVAATAARAVKSLAVVLGLLLAAIGFVLIQDRLDRKDPRLALAPLESDVARFE